MILRPPRSTRTDTLFPYTTLFRSAFRVAVNPPSHPSNLARLRSLARPAEQGLLLAALLLFLAGTAQAAGSSMPWEGPLQSILESIQGPVARIVAVIIIIATGLALAFADTSGGFRQLRSEERRVGKECGRTCRYRGAPE